MGRRPPPAAIDPERRRSRALVWFFAGVMARQMRRNFHAVRVAGVPQLPRDRSVVIYCNHPSWWDPAFIAVLATRLFPDRRSFGPIDAAALRQYPFMAQIGLFPVEPESFRGAAGFLKVGRALLAQTDTILWVTAEGRFTDPRSRPIELRPGLAALLAHAPRSVAVPLALEYPFWTEKTPEALARFGTPVETSDPAASTGAALNGRLAAELEVTMDALARDAQAKDAGAFISLLAGSAGIGGVYDVWRRGRTLLSGRRFDPSHGGGHRGFPVSPTSVSPTEPS